MTVDFMKDLLSHSQLHDKIVAAKKEIAEMKTMYRDEVFVEKSSALVKSVVQEGSKLQIELIGKIDKLEKERSALNELAIEPKKIDLEKLYMVDGKERKINTDYLTNLPLVQSYILAQLEQVKTVDEYKTFIQEVLMTTEHDIVVFDALKNAIDRFYPEWFVPDATAMAGTTEPNSFEFVLARNDALKRLAYATGTPSEKARFERLATIDNELGENQAELKRLSEVDVFRNEYERETGYFFNGERQNTDSYFKQSPYSS